MILKNVHQHNCFITQGSYIGYMFRLIARSSSGLFSRLSHKVLCTRWDPGVFTSIKYIKFNICPTRCDLFNLLHFCRQLYMFRVLTPIFRS